MLFFSWRLNFFGIWDVNLFRGKALEIDRVQSAFHNKCRLQMRIVYIFGWIFPVTLASLISRSLIFAWKEFIFCVGYTMYATTCVNTQYLYWWCAPVKKLMEIYCFCWLHPQQLLPSKRKNGIDTPLALIVVLLRVSVDHLGFDQHPQQARAQGDQRIKRADCSQARLPRLCWSDLKPLCLEYFKPQIKDIWWHFSRQEAAMAVWTWTTRPILASKTWSTSWRRSTRTRDTRVSYQGLVSYSIIQLHWHCCCKQGGLLGACWHRCRWQGHRERQRGLRLWRLRRSRLWSHFPMGASSRCSRH